MDLTKITAPFLEEFPVDRSGNPMQRSITDYFGALVPPASFDNPHLVHFNAALGEELGLGTPEKKEDYALLHAQYSAQNISPYATVYGGHQFGRWAGQLGDGRALFLGEVTSPEGIGWELQWKGAGATPFSRHADGRAVLRSTIREYLISEAMHHLGVPTTRSLSISLTGEEVVRDILYSGNPQREPGALMVRAAQSFLRFGHFEYWSALGDLPKLQQLADYVLRRYYPLIGLKGKESYEALFDQICRRTAELVVEWMRVGFTHGVLNTDNMSVLGLGIDYGPYAFLDAYDLNFTSNTTDLPGRRYAFGQQGKIAQWNLWQLANALYPLLGESKALESALDRFPEYFWKLHDRMVHRKFGFAEQSSDSAALVVSIQSFMQSHEADYTLFFYLLSEQKDEAAAMQALPAAFYRSLSQSDLTQLQQLLQRYFQLLGAQDAPMETAQNIMQETNPSYILRNYMLYDIIVEVEKGEMEGFRTAFERLQNPYQRSADSVPVLRPHKYDGLPGCTMLSCSS